jgi:cell division septation protein DedD
VQQANAEPPITNPSSGTAPKAAYTVQISSARSEAGAQALFKALQLKFPAQLRNRKPIIVKKSFADHGVYYRNLVGPFTTAEEANDFCGNLQAAGGECKAMLAAEAGDN